MDTINDVQVLSIKEANRLIKATMPEDFAGIWDDPDAEPFGTLLTFGDLPSVADNAKWRRYNDWVGVEFFSYEIEEADFISEILNGNDFSGETVLLDTLPGSFVDKMFLVKMENIVEFATNFDEYVKRNPGEPFIQASPYAFVFLRLKMAFVVKSTGLILEVKW